MIAMTNFLPTEVDKAFISQLKVDSFARGDVWGVLNKFVAQAARPCLIGVGQAGETPALRSSPNLFVEGQGIIGTAFAPAIDLRHVHQLPFGV